LKRYPGNAYKITGGLGDSDLGIGAFSGVKFSDDLVDFDFGSIAPRAAAKVG
jgi:hypothetical protein